MAKQLAVQKSTHSLLKLVGSRRNILRVDGYFAWLKCPVCSGNYKTRLRVYTHYHRALTCSRSCAMKLNWMYPKAVQWRKKVSTIMKNNRKNWVVWNTGVPWSKEVKAKLAATRKSKGLLPWSGQRGGNGQIAKAEQLVRAVLPQKYIFNYAIKLGSRQPGYPTNYKVDFGNPTVKVALEIDGSSHRNPQRQVLDMKKETKLRELGWTVLRMKNEEVFRLSGTLKLKTALTSRLKALL